MGLTCTRVLEFDAGHRLLKHEGKCRNVHGHRYRVEIEAQAERLDDVGRVVDFQVIKQRIGGWLDEQWDHGFIVEVGDPFVEALVAARSKVYRLPVSPTAENLAVFLLNEVCDPLLQGTGVTVVQVRVWETPNCHATAERFGKRRLDV